MASDGFDDGSIAARNVHKMREKRLSERVAVLESKLEEAERLLHMALDKLSKQGAEIERYKGMWGGIILCASVISVVLALFRSQISSAVARLFSK